MSSVSSSIQAIIFDFGGVVINWDPHNLFNKYFSNDSRAISNFLTEINFSSWNLAQDKGYPFTKAVSELSVQFPQYAHLIRAYDEEWEQSIAGIIPGTVEILQRLKATGYRLYGLTNWSAEKFHLVKHKYEVFDLFEDIVVSGEVKLIKPDPAIFHLLLKRIHRSAEECFLVDDSLQNIEIAKVMGFATHQFTAPAQLELALHSMGILL
jgi:2-haloacid dehalogenase